MPTAKNAKTRILDAALDLFHAQGVNATGLEQILAASDTGKSQFYHYFQDKEELVLEVMRHFQARLASGAIPLKLELNTWKDLEQWFGFFVEMQRSLGCERSCPIGTIAAELTDDAGALRQEACAIFEASRQPLIRLFEAMRADGRLRRSASPAALADFCHSVVQGGLLISKVERRIEPLQHAVQQALAHLRSLRPSGPARER